MAELTYDRLQRLTSFLLVLVLTFFASTVAMAVYLYVQHSKLDGMRAGLLSQLELQAELLGGSESDRAVYPHAARNISYVINPYLDKVSWHAGPDGGYAVNSLGLRGPEPGPKAEGVTRVVLLGDSVLFGFKIADQHTVAAQLDKLASDKFGTDRFEFITVALPGWNTRDQAAFLEHHLESLAPDVLVWSLLRNDIWDSAGPVPPGVLGRFAGPQKTGAAPFWGPNDTLRDLQMPAVRARWQQNLQLIEASSERYQLPVVLLWWGSARAGSLFWRTHPRAFLDPLLSDTGFSLPVVHLPRELQRDTARWCINDNDCHPAPWATERVAIGLLAQLASQGIVPMPEWTAAEATVVAAFADAEADSASTADTEQHHTLRAEALPGEFRWEGGPPHAGILFGVTGNRLQQQGTLYLSTPRSQAGHLRVNLTPGSPGPDTQRTVRFIVKSRAGAVEESTLPVGSQPLSLRLPLPASDDPVYEIAWLFNYAECEGPSECYAARLDSIQFE